MTHHTRRITPIAIVGALVLALSSCGGGGGGGSAAAAPANLQSAPGAAAISGYYSTSHSHTLSASDASGNT